jgi:hypothetical protein
VTEVTNLPVGPIGRRTVVGRSWPAERRGHSAHFDTEDEKVPVEVYAKAPNLRTTIVHLHLWVWAWHHQFINMKWKFIDSASCCPRKTLGFQTLISRLQASIASTHETTLFLGSYLALLHLGQLAPGGRPRYLAGDEHFVTAFEGEIPRILFPRKQCVSPFLLAFATRYGGAAHSGSGRR